MLVSVSTQSSTSQPFDMTISSSMMDEDGTTATTSTNKICCFICNTTVSDNFFSLFDTLSKHSLTHIFDFVWKFLGDQPSVREDSIDAANASTVCTTCLNKIDQYDLACVTAEKLEKELRHELSQTETLYALQQNVLGPYETNPNETTTNESQAELNHTDTIQMVNLDSPSPTEINVTEQQVIIDDENDENVEARCIIELSDDEAEEVGVVNDASGRGDDETLMEEDQAIELSDDDVDISD